MDIWICIEHPKHAWYSISEEYSYELKGQASIFVELIFLMGVKVRKTMYKIKMCRLLIWSMLYHVRNG